MADDYMKMPMPGVAKAMADKAPPSSSSDRDDAASDMLAAIKANDAKALSAALQRAYESCMSDEESAEGEA